MRRIIAITVFLSIMIVASMGYAHPPSDVEISFDPETQVLTAVIVHGTSNPDKHYIEKVDVGLNGKEIIEQIISREDNGRDQTVSYLIPDVKTGDVISVEGYCNLSGKLKKEIKIKTEK